MNNLVEKFCIEFAKLFNATKEDLEFWNKENKLNEKIIIAGPSSKIGLIDLTKTDDIGEWKSYGKCSEPTKKMDGRFVFDNQMYFIPYLRIIYKMIPETVEVIKHSVAILFKITDDIAVGICEDGVGDGFYYNDEGVMFVPYEWEDTKDKRFIKWINNVAKREHGDSKIHTWEEEIYKFEYFFEEEEEMGDMMML